MISHERLLELVSYNPETGEFKSISSKPGHPAGRILGNYDRSTGYLRACLDYQTYYLHRLAWFYVHKEWACMVDHIDLNKRNNRLANLRKCTHSENLLNRGCNNNNKLGVKGLHYEEETKRYKAQIMVNRQKQIKNFSVAAYGTKEEAFSAAYKWIREIRQELHGEFTNHG